MESYLIISYLNDFIFCPRSIYFHSLYQKYNCRIYKDIPQIKGILHHQNIDKKKYSSSKKFIQSLAIYSEKYNLCGKIDLYDSEKKILIERKAKIKKIYDGYLYQVYAQYFCMTEMGYSIENIFLHSLEDNQRYEIKIPQKKEKKEFENLIKKIKTYSILEQDKKQNKKKVNSKKCENCIYNHLCDEYYL